MPDTPTLTWLGDRRVRIDGLHHPELKHPRAVEVHVPANHEAAGKGFPVLYNFDGEWVLSPVGGRGRKGMRMDVALDRLVAAGAASPAFLVAIPNSKPGDRGGEIGPRAFEDGVPAMHRFISEVVHPFLLEQFSILDGAAFTGISGFSLGGLSAFSYGWMFPEFYGLVGAISPSVQMRRDLVREVREGEGGFSGTRFWFGNGGHEFFERNLVIRDLVRGMARRGWVPERDVQFALQFGGGHSYAACAERMENMLGFLLSHELPESRGIRVVGWESPEADRLDVSRHGEGARGLLQVDYPHGRFSHLIGAEWSDPVGSFHFHEDDPGLPIPAAGGGESLVEGHWLHWSAEKPAVWDAEVVPEFRMIPRRGEGPTEDWLPGAWIAGANEALELAVEESDDGLLIGVRAPEGVRRVQLGIDTGSLHRLPLHRHLSDRDDIPEAVLRAAVGFTPEQAEKQKDFVEGRWIESGGTGKEAHFRIPHDALDALDGQPWDILRINAFARTDASLDPDDGSWHWWKAKESDTWWQPPWRSGANIVGSGVMIRS